MTKRDELLLDVVRKLDVQGVASWAIDKLSDHIESNPPVIPDSSPVECECDPAPHWHNAHGELRFHAVPAPVAGEVCEHRFCNPDRCFIKERDEAATVAANATAGEPRLAKGWVLSADSVPLPVKWRCTYGRCGAVAPWRRGGHGACEAHAETMGVFEPAPVVPADSDRIYPCADCGVMRTKSEGGTTFTCCDDCWDKSHAKPFRPNWKELARRLRKERDMAELADLKRTTPVIQPPAPTTPVEPCQTRSTHIHHVMFNGEEVAVFCEGSKDRGISSEYWPCKHFLYMKCKHDGCQPQPTTPVQVEPGPPRKDNP